MVIANALKPALFLEEFPKAVVDVHIIVIQADGGTRCAAINAASLALADAGIPMKSLVPAVAVGKADGKLLVDLGDEEDKYGEGDVPMAIMPQTDEITLLQQDGFFKREELVEAMQMGINSCKYLHELQKDALKRVYVQKTSDSDGEEFEDDLETDLGDAEIMGDE